MVPFPSLLGADVPVLFYLINLYGGSFGLLAQFFLFIVTYILLVVLLTSLLWSRRAPTGSQIIQVRLSEYLLIAPYLSGYSRTSIYLAFIDCAPSGTVIRLYCTHIPMPQKKNMTIGF